MLADKPGTMSSGSGWQDVRAARRPIPSRSCCANWWTSASSDSRSRSTAPTSTAGRSRPPARASTRPISLPTSPRAVAALFHRGEWRLSGQEGASRNGDFRDPERGQGPAVHRLDLLSCRNLAIYLEPALQERLVLAFHYALKPGGVLLLSPSESIGEHHELFAPISRKWRLYRSLEAAGSSRGLLGSGLPWVEPAGPHPRGAAARAAREVNLAELTRTALLHSYAPASVTTDIHGAIVYVHGDTGNYLRPAPGQASLDVASMARPGAPARSAGRHPLGPRGHGGRRLRGKRHRQWQSPPGVLQCAASERSGIRPALPGNQLQGRRRAIGGCGCGTTETLARRCRTAPHRDLERDLTYTRARFQATIEDPTSWQQELKATNEEMQSTNEELQSTNESSKHPRKNCSPERRTADGQCGTAGQDRAARPHPE